MSIQEKTEATADVMRFIALTNKINGLQARINGLKAERSAIVDEATADHVQAIKDLGYAGVAEFKTAITGE